MSLEQCGFVQCVCDNHNLSAFELVGCYDLDVLDLGGLLKDVVDLVLEL